ncbi:MAG: LptF/LptG family permease, partial [Micavibrio sp.]
MRLTTRYITKNILMSALFVLLILLAVIWLTQSLRFLELIVNSNAPVSLFMKMIALSLPRFPEIIIPVALVAAVIFSYNRMMMDSEIVVMRSAGISPRRLAVPALVVAGLSVFVMLLFSAWLSPAARAEMQDLRQVIRAEFSTFLLKEGVFNPVGD